MKTEIFEKQIKEVEDEVFSLYSGVKRYKIYGFFKEVRELLEYRKVKPFVDISEGGHVFRCQRCGLYMESDNNTYEEYKFCPYCGQRGNE